MSYDPRLVSRPYGASREEEDDTQKRSVRAAREKEQKTQKQTPDRSRIIRLPQRPNQLVSQFSAQKGPPQDQAERSLTPLDSRGNGNTPSPTPQWPLPNEADAAINASYGQPSTSRQQSQRPLRPVSDDYRDSYQTDHSLSPISAAPSSRPLTNTSALSESSSLGDIPDFPVALPPMPVVQPLPRRQPILGPPPSARRGPPSYYTQMSYVSPIAEESESRAATIRSHRGSFASSNVFSSKGEDLYQDDGRSDDDDIVTSDYEKRFSRESDHDDQSGLVQPALVRQASLGRRTKPSLMTIKSVDSFEKRTPSLKRKPVAEGDSASQRAVGIGGALLAARDGIAGRPALGSQNTTLGSGSVLLDPSSSEESSLASKPARVRLAELDPDDEFDDRDFEKDFEKDIMVSPVYAKQKGTKQTKLADRVGKRRPPRIDVDAVRDAEARGSLTSLPELIRRATRLAANLDRGKTASRLGLDMWESGAPEKGMRRSGSLSDMLAAFPPPGEATPTGNRTPNPQPGTKWPSIGGGFGGRESPFSGKSNGRRRCCGMPMWTFVTLLIVLLFLIAAAVVIPIVLIVIPKMRDNQASAAQATSGNPKLPELPVPTAGGQKDQCDGIVTCQNEGVAVFNADRSCNCVCINGFTGKVCETKGDTACTTTNIAGTADNATVGVGIPRLIEAAQTNFSIPLDSQRLLSLFSDLGLSCNTENALVTFNGLAIRTIPGLETALEPSRSLPLLDMPHEDHDIEKRQAIGEVGQGNQAQQNTVPTATSAPQASATAVPTTPISSNSTAIDFTRIGVLLLLQETGKLDDAANAQVMIQDFLSDDSSGDSTITTIDLGLFEMDLVNFSIEFQNGTIIQARPANPTS